MATVELVGLHRVKAKGRIYYYAYRGGPRIKAPYGTPAFHAEFSSAQRTPEALELADPKRFSAYVIHYKADDAFLKLAASTKREWLKWLDKVQDRFGALSIKLFDKPEIRLDIRKWRDQWKTKPRTADYAKQVLSRVLSFAVEEGALRSNPCEGIPTLYKGDRSEIIWSDADLARLVAVASPEVAQAARLAALSGLRQGDLLKLPWTAVKEQSIEIATGKSSGRRTALVPLTEALRELLSGIPHRAPTVLTNSLSRPWQSGFGASWTKTMALAFPTGSDLHFHDLRGTAATNFYRAGFTEREIAQTMGWSEQRVSKLLDKYVRRGEILKDRVQRIEALKVLQPAGNTGASPPA